ncbi:MAG: ankyrin repeat domain-containing protein, partial [Gammaproteobacteria bacterium]
MFSFHTSNVTVNVLDIEFDSIIDALENKKLSEDQQRKIIPTFGIEKRTKHRNSLLLHALAWNKLRAAAILIKLDLKKEALNAKDAWPTCLNTPLILAAKIGATGIIKELIALGAELDEQDHNGFTALHYACILRNHDAIETLLQKHAGSHLKDAFGKLPLDYYKMEISEADLSYRYGPSTKNPRMLAQVYDGRKNYFATEKKYFSALRWFIPHIIVNTQLEKTTEP